MGCGTCRNGVVTGLAWPRGDAGNGDAASVCLQDIQRRAVAAALASQAAKIQRLEGTRSHHALLAVSFNFSSPLHS